MTLTDQSASPNGCCPGEPVAAGRDRQIKRPRPSQPFRDFAGMLE